MGNEKVNFPSEEIHAEKEGQFPVREVLRMGEVNADFHVIHFGFDEQVGGGDNAASLDIQKIVEFAVRFIPEDKTIVIGGHPADSDQIELDKGIFTDNLTSDEKHLLFLQKQKEAIEGMCKTASEKYGREGPRILFGIEADITINEEGTPGIIPPPEVLTRAGLDVITASLHGGERIKDWRPEKLADAFEYVLTTKVNEKLLVNRLGHPFGELRKIYGWDKERFGELMGLAKENQVTIEINASKDFDEEILHFLVENGNYLDFGSDHHAFRYWLKESVPTGVELSSEERELLDLLARENKFKRRERLLWVGSAYNPGINQLLKNIPEEERQAMNDRIWQLYKHHGELEEREPEVIKEAVPLKEREKELEEVFVREREEIIDELTPETIENKEGLQDWLRRELTFLYKLFPIELERDPEKHKWYKTRFAELEDKIAEAQISFSDTKALIQKLHEAKMKVGIPPRLFVSAWPREEQEAFLRKEHK